MTECQDCTRLGKPCACPGSIRPKVEPIDPEPGIRRHADEIRMRILRRILDNARWAELVDLSIERSTSIGAQEYGNASYDKPDDVLEWEGACEIADLIFYEHIPLERGA